MLPAGELFTLDDMFDRFLSYCLEPLPHDFTPTEVISLIFGAFSVTAAFVVVLHAFIPGPQPVMLVLLHAVGVGTSYTFAFVLMALVIVLLRFFVEGIVLNVWQFWLCSFLTYVVGFFFSPVSDMLTADVKYELHTDLREIDTVFHFFRLMPVWALITYLFILVLQKRGLQQELGELTRINRQLESMAPRATETEMIEFVAGKKTVAIPADHISHISVDDHYCYVHSEKDGAEQKLDISGPLASVEPLLPETFVKVHRSHIVNLEKISQVEKRDRSYALLLSNNRFRVPVSRGRLQEVLPRLQRFLGT